MITCPTHDRDLPTDNSYFVIRRLTIPSIAKILPLPANAICQIHSVVDALEWLYRIEVNPRVHC